MPSFNNLPNARARYINDNGTPTNIFYTFLLNLIRSGSPQSTFDSRAEAMGADISSDVDYLELRGFYTSGDGGDANYRVVDADPGHAGSFQSADGRWWEITDRANLRLRQFGAIGDDTSHALSTLYGSLADAQKVYRQGGVGAVALTDQVDWAAFMAAQDCLPDEGGVIWVDDGIYRCNKPLYIGNGGSGAKSTKQNIRIVSYGTNEGTGIVGATCSATVKCVGSSLAAAVWVLGPVACEFSGIGINVNGNATRGLYIVHAYHSEFRRIFIQNYNEIGMSIEAFQTYPPDVFLGCTSNLFEFVDVIAPFLSTSRAVTVGLAGTNGSGADVNGCLFRRCTWEGPNNALGGVLELLFCDNVTFDRCLGFSVGGGAPAIKCVPTSGGGFFPCVITIRDCPTIGAYDFPTGWTPQFDRGIVFLPLHREDFDTILPALPDHPAVSGIASDGVYFAGSRGAPNRLYGNLTRISVSNTNLDNTVASYALVGGRLGKTRVLRMNVRGIYLNNTGSTQTVTITIKLGSQTLLSFVASMPTAAGYRALVLDAEVANISGNTSSQEASGTLVVGASASAGTGAGLVDFSMVQSNDTTTVDTTSNQTIQVNVQHSASSSNLTFFFNRMTIRLD